MILYTPGDHCEVCGKTSEHLANCNICGAYICKDCMTNEGICLVCTEALCYLCREYLSNRACDICGRPVCEDHSKKIREATICDACRNNGGERESQ